MYSIIFCVIHGYANRQLKTGVVAAPSPDFWSPDRNRAGLGETWALMLGRSQARVPAGRRPVAGLHRPGRAPLLPGQDEPANATDQDLQADFIEYWPRLIAVGTVHAVNQAYAVRSASLGVQLYAGPEEVPN